MTLRLTVTAHLSFLLTVSAIVVWILNWIHCRLSVSNHSLYSVHELGSSGTFPSFWKPPNSKKDKIKQNYFCLHKPSPVYSFVNLLLHTDTSKFFRGQCSGNVATVLLITLTTVNGCCCCDPLHLSKRRKQLDIMVAASSCSLVLLGDI